MVFRKAHCIERVGGDACDKQFTIFEREGCLVVFVDELKSDFSGDSGTLSLRDAEVALIELIERRSGIEISEIGNVFRAKNNWN